MLNYNQHGSRNIYSVSYITDEKEFIRCERCNNLISQYFCVQDKKTHCKKIFCEKDFSCVVTEGVESSFNEISENSYRQYVTIRESEEKIDRMQYLVNFTLFITSLILFLEVYFRFFR